MNTAPLSRARQDVLRAELPRVAELLQQRRASEIDEAVIDDLVTLFWLEWSGGRLRLTQTGNNICLQQDTS